MCVYDIFNCGYFYKTRKVKNNNWIHKNIIIHITAHELSSFKMGQQVQCNQCGHKHERPVGKRCRQNAIEHESPQSNFNEEPSGTSIHEYTLDKKLEIIATVLNEIKANQANMLHRVTVLEKRTTPEQSRRVSDDSIWDMLKQPDQRDNGSSPTLHQQRPVSTNRPSPHYTHVPVTIPSLHELGNDPDIDEMSHRLIQEGKMLPIITEKQSYSQNYKSKNVPYSRTVSRSSKIVKSGRDRIGGNDNGRIYVPWPQEFVYVGPDRKRVAYDELTQGQFSAGLFGIIEQEQDINVKQNMIKFCAGLHQNMVDFGFIPVRGALAVCLSAIEDGRASWSHYETLESLQRQYLLKVDTQTMVQNTVGSELPQVKTQICQSFNSGKCSSPHGHLYGGIVFSHYCSYCITQGMMFTHSESQCRKRLQNIGNISIRSQTSNQAIDIG